MTPEEQIRKMADYLHAITTRGESLSKSNRTRRGQAYVYTVSMDALADASRQFAEMVLSYLDGTLAPLEDDGLPF